MPGASKFSGIAAEEQDIKETNMYTSLNRRAASAYAQVGVQSSVDGASPHQLIQLLFDALEKALNAAKGAMQRGDIGEKGVQIGKARSEEHTSELQSQSNLVCRLLLEKKKTYPRAPR